METLGMKPKQFIADLYESPMAEINAEQYGAGGDQCVCCNRPVKENHETFVHMNTDWMAVRADIDEQDVEKLTGSESQGCFPIGNECAKKMPKEFIIKLRP